MPTTTCLLRLKDGRSLGARLESAQPTDKAEVTYAGDLDAARAHHLLPLTSSAALKESFRQLRRRLGGDLTIEDER
jgi:hypothetical protein